MDSTSTIGEELESFTLLIKNYSCGTCQARSECLLDFVKRLTWQENVEVGNARPDGTSVKFTNVPTDAEEVMEQLKQETFMGLTLDVIQLKTIKKMHLANIKPNVQALEICLYMEQPRFVPPSTSMTKYQVEVLHIDRNKKFALVEVPEEADVDLYIDVEHSNILGENLRISMYKGTKKDQGPPKSKARRRGGRGRNPVQGGTGPRQEGPAKTPQERLLKSPPRFVSPGPQMRPMSLTPADILPNQDKNNESCPVPFKDMPFIEWIEISEVDREKCQLMKKHLVDLRKSLGSGWRIWMNDKEHKIGIGHCDQEKLHCVIVAVQNLLDAMNSAFVQIPKDFAMILKSSSGYSFLIKFLEQRQLRAVYYYDRIKNRGMILGENREVARSAAQALGKDFVQYISEGVLTTGDPARDKEWEKFSSSLMNNHLVFISQKVDNYGAGKPHVKRAMLQGFGSDPMFSIAKARVEEKLRNFNSESNFVSGHGSPRPMSGQQKQQQKITGSCGSIPQSGSTALSSNPNIKPEGKSQNAKHQATMSKEAAGNSSKDQRTQPAGITSEETSIPVEMSSIVYKFFKTHLSNFISNKCKYMMEQKSLEFKGKPDEVQPVVNIIKSLLMTIKEKQAMIKIAGITEGFFNEKDSELRTEISKFEQIHTFAVGFKTDKDKNTVLLYAYQSSNPKGDLFPTMIKDLLMKFSKKRFIKCADMFVQNGMAGAVMTEHLGNTISRLKHSHVKIDYEGQSDTIILKGREMFFDTVEKTLVETIQKYMSENPQVTSGAKVDMNLTMRFKNMPDFLRLIGHEDIFAPDHWTTFKGNLRHVSSDKGEIVQLNPDSKMYKYVLDMINSTWTYGQVGLGRDAALLKHRNINVINIYSVENVFQYKRYMSRVKEFCMQNSSSTFSRLDTKLELPVMTKEAAISNGACNLLWEINEYHLFHGTRLDSKQAIIDQGLDFRLGSRHALFGQGIYFAESSTKSDQYADPKDSRSNPGENLYMFVARVFMGNMHEAIRPEPYKRPPCIDPDCSSDQCSVHQLNHSVLGTHTTAHPLASYNFLVGRLKGLLADPSSDHKEVEKTRLKLKHVRPLLFREFVVYDHAQCVPEFLVEYKRI